MSRDALTRDAGAFIDFDDIPAEAPPRSWRVDRRTRKILVAAAAAVVLVNALAAWAYWRVAGPGSTAATTSAEVTYELRGASSLDVPLRRGAIGDLTLRIPNDNGVAIRITEVLPGDDPVVADDVSRDAGCVSTGVALVRESLPVRWDVPRNTVGAFTLRGGLVMAASADAACDGATYYTIPVRVRGEVLP